MQWEHFLDPDFFLTDIAALEQWRWVLSRIVSEDKLTLTDLIERTGHHPYRMFSTRDRFAAIRSAMLS